MACTFKIPFFLQVLLGFVLGVVVGELAGSTYAVAGITTRELGQLGLLVIRLLKALAVPLIFFATLDGLVRSAIPGRACLRLVTICGFNVTVALTIGLTMMNTLKPGVQWQGRLRQLMDSLPTDVLTTHPPSTAGKAELSPLHGIIALVPESLVDPLQKNNIISVVLLALLIGVACQQRRNQALETLEAVRESDAEELEAAGQARETLRHLEAVSLAIAGVFQLLVGALEFVVAAIPFSVFGVVSMAVGRVGLGIFGVLWTYMWVLCTGMALHALVYYPTMAWIFAGLAPWDFWRGGSTALMVGLSTNSSLATMPVTLRCLRRMGISDSNARLSTCIGTNLNNDGITLYEAMAALFLAQACGYDLSVWQQLVVVLASLMAGLGVAGVPEAGLVVLPLVLAAAGLPEEVVMAALPLLLPVDWLVGRCRAGVNVTSDMLVAILLEAWEPGLSLPAITLGADSKSGVGPPGSLAAGSSYKDA